MQNVEQYMRDVHHHEPNKHRLTSNSEKNMLSNLNVLYDIFGSFHSPAIFMPSKWFLAVAAAAAAAAAAKAKSKSAAAGSKSTQNERDERYILCSMLIFMI